MLKLIQGDGLNPLKLCSLPSIIHFDIPETIKERVQQAREVIEHDRMMRGIRAVVIHDSNKKET